MLFVVDEKPFRVTNEYKVTYKDEDITLEQEISPYGETWWIVMENASGRVYMDGRDTREEALSVLHLYLENYES